LRQKKRTAFVPKVVFSSVVMGVIPACALAACGSESSSLPSGDASPPDGSTSDVPLSVADAGFADTGAADTGTDTFFGVAAVGYCGFCDSASLVDTGDAPGDGPAGDASEGGD
jgi:hypothetical protein